PAPPQLTPAAPISMPRSLETAAPRRLRSPLTKSTLTVHSPPLALQSPPAPVLPAPPPLSSLAPSSRFATKYQRGAADSRPSFFVGGQKKLDRFLFRSAKSFEITLRALGIACVADAATMPDQLMRKGYPPVLRQNPH